MNPNWLQYEIVPPVWRKTRSSYTVNNTKSMVNVLKFEHCSLSDLKKCCLPGLKVTKRLSEEPTGKTLIRLLLKQSDHGLPCLLIWVWAVWSWSSVLLIWVCTVWLSLFGRQLVFWNIYHTPVYAYRNMCGYYGQYGTIVNKKDDFWFHNQYHNLS